MPDELPVFTTSEGEALVLRAYEGVLRRWPQPYEELDVPTSFGMTHVVAGGRADGPPVVFLHAMFATAMSWYLTVGSLGATHRTFAVDVMGEANRSRPTRVIRSLGDYEQWFRELADGLGLRDVSLVGNSMGGFGAATLAMRLPDRVTNLVLIGPAATFHSIAPFYRHMFVPKAIHLLLPRLPGADRSVRRSLHWAFAGLPSQGPWYDLFALVMRHGSTQSRVFPRVYDAAQLAQITAPTLLILGDRERVYPIGAASSAARRLMPLVQVQIVEDAHHIAAISQPEAVNTHLLRFLTAPEPDPAQHPVA
jgi:pimeloyl-ACP methyl ester carboxylesterase